MKNLTKKKLIHFVSMVCFTTVLNFAQTCYADTTLHRSTDGYFIRLSTRKIANTYSGTADNDIKGRPYESLLWPVNVPVVHPYNPALNNLREDVTSPVGTKNPEFTLTAKLSSIYASAIPCNAPH